MAIVRHPEPPPREAEQQDRELRGRAGRFRSVGAVLALIGVAGVVLGGAVYALGTAGAAPLEGVGVMIAAVAAAPAIAGIVLLAIAATGAWAGRRRPFA
jgi:hypothetical protein